MFVAAQLICHCGDCRIYHSAPMVSVIVVPETAVKVTQGHEHVKQYNHTTKNNRYFCSKCSTPLYNTIPAFHLTGVFPSVVTSNCRKTYFQDCSHVIIHDFNLKVPSFAFKPSYHTYYAEKVLSVPDALPK